MLRSDSRGLCAPDLRLGNDRRDLLREGDTWLMREMLFRESVERPPCTCKCDTCLRVASFPDGDESVPIRQAPRREAV